MSKDEKDPHVDNITVANSDDGADAAESGLATQEESKSPLRTKKALIAWMILCYSTGPTGGMVARYVPAVLQSSANLLGHQPGSNKPCAKRGVIRCVVPFGTGEVDYNSYV